MLYTAGSPRKAPAQLVIAGHSVGTSFGPLSLGVDNTFMWALLTWTALGRGQHLLPLSLLARRDDTVQREVVEGGLTVVVASVGDGAARQQHLAGLLAPRRRGEVQGSEAILVL